MSSFVPRSDYHSALKPPVTDAPAVDRWEGLNVLAFVHDLMTAPTLPAEYAKVEVLVADLPWQTGFKKFNERAGITETGRTYAAFMRRVREIVESTGVPTYLITGRHALPKLPTPDVILPMVLNQDEAVAIGYRPGSETDFEYGVAQEFLLALATRYRVAGDFCCGYGRTARTFLRQGKRAVVSDFNASCVGYISQHATEWNPS